MSGIESNTLEEEILKWTATREDEVVFNPKNGYYPFEVVEEAFKKGAKHAEKAMTQKMREKFYDNGKMVASVVKLLGKIFNKEKIKTNKLFIHISTDSSKLLLTVEEKTYLTDKFIDLAHGTASKIQNEYFDKGLNIQIGFLNDNLSLDNTSLQSDGYDIAFDIIKRNIIY